ncbi:MAG TPA: spermidine/putrescine ABC transporter substrate-binding protein [Segeticoccus sp.]|uniref:polyamine ABC transporter substrate-binding protein n=1 Tax=Segeticoccus sp. TaxID=2706531 RepID=UPI002D7E521B|nr:spermidine/putrescine ABC transporter substrate-binding protein [Segeticoccus sp.]HET8599066.1 spermidine/putrescine ABC transporter substrate-binding protein [Segeticoccus sp.]
MSSTDRDPQQPDAPQVDPVLLRGLTMPRLSRLSRRDVLRMAGVGGAAVGAGALLSACSVGGQGTQSAGGTGSTGAGGATSSASAQDAVQAYWADKKKTGQLTWANWPLYIDTAGKGKHPSLDQFEKQSGIKVAYREDIQDNPSFFAKIRPTLQAGQYTGYDLAVISDGQVLTRLMALGYLVPLDHSQLPNFAKYAGAKYKDPDYDPGNRYTIPWQAGFSGLAYNPDKVGREITSYEDLLDPKFKGKIGMFGDAGELGNAAMFALGIDAVHSTEADWKKAAAWLEKVKPNVRKYYEQDYVQSLVNGDIWVTQAWSGDIFQSNLSGSNLKFVIPKEGGLLWTDNFLILKYAKHPVDALMLMDYYYQPKVAAEVAEWVNYVTPVPKAQQVVLHEASKAKGKDAKDLRQLAHSYAVFPTPKTYATVSTGRTLKLDEIDTFNSIFEPIFQS